MQRLGPSVKSSLPMRQEETFIEDLQAPVVLNATGPGLPWSINAGTTAQMTLAREAKSPARTQTVRGRRASEFELAQRAS